MLSYYELSIIFRLFSDQLNSQNSLSI